MGLCCSAYSLLCTPIETVARRSFVNVKGYAKIVKIYDGDTFTIITKLNKAEPYYQYQLRLAGLDAPELKPLLSIADRDLHVQAGKCVRDVLKTKLPEGSLIWVEFDKEDKYGRLLGTVYTVKRKFFTYRKDYNLCEWLIKNHYALPYSGKTKSDFTVHFLKNIQKTSDAYI
jgi:endonuclease YncB( thermonuclease family)